MRIHGVSLHYYNESENSDKFYRVFVWCQNGGEDPWCVAYHWGHDGSRGQVKTEQFGSEKAAEMALDRKVNEKMSKGYEYLGRGDIDLPGIGRGRIAMQTVGQVLHDRIGRAPVKLPAGFSFVIEEEPDVADLIA